MLAMKADTPLESTILFDARVSARGEGDRTLVPIELIVYPAQLSPELLDKGAKLYRVSMHVAAYGPDGRLITHRDVAVNSKVSKNEDWSSNQVGFHCIRTWNCHEGDTICA